MFRSGWGIAISRPPLTSTATWTLPASKLWRIGFPIVFLPDVLENVLETASHSLFPGEGKNPETVDTQRFQGVMCLQKRCSRKSLPHCGFVISGILSMAFPFRSFTAFTSFSSMASCRLRSSCKSSVGVLTVKIVPYFSKSISNGS